MKHFGTRFVPVIGVIGLVVLLLIYLGGEVRMGSALARRRRRSP